MGQISCSGLWAGLWVLSAGGPGLALPCSSLLPQDTGLYYHRYLQEVINVLETDGHFREKLQAANAEDIKVRCGWVRARWAPMRRCVLRAQSLSLGKKKSLLQVAQLRKDRGRGRQNVWLSVDMGGPWLPVSALPAVWPPCTVPQFSHL